MKKNSIFHFCGECSHKEKREHLKEGEFYCSIAATILSNGIITYDTDASNCVQEGWFIQVYRE